jgi:putative transposase
MYNPDKHHRHSIRLKGYDYSQSGIYFVTMCVQDKVCLLGKIVDGRMQANTYGEIVKENWRWLAEQYPYVILDEWIVMPNHFHGILCITNSDRGVGPRIATNRGSSRTAPIAKRKPLGRLIGAFKTVSTKYINELRNTPGVRFWQRNYYEHIVRNERELNNIRQYIVNNPLHWEFDTEHLNDKALEAKRAYWKQFFADLNRKTP